MSPAIWGAITALGWGVADVMGRYVGQRLGLVIALFGMMLSSGLALALYAWTSGVTLVWAPAQLWALALAGVGIAGATLLLYWALVRGPLSVASPITASYPAINLAFAVFSGVALGLVEWLAIAAVMLGVVLTARGGESAHEAAPRGGRLGTVLLALGAACGFGFGIEGMRVAQAAYGEVQTLLAVRLCGTLGAAVALVLLPRQRRPVRLVDWPLLLLLGLLDIGAYFALLAGTAGLHGEIAVVVASAYCVVPVLFGRLFLKEAVSPGQALGILLIVAGVGYLSGLDAAAA